MRVPYEAQGGHVTERFRVDFEGHELQALADLANVIQGDDSLARALARAGREWRLDADPQGMLPGSADPVETIACLTENAPASRERSGAEPRGVNS